MSCKHPIILALLGLWCFGAQAFELLPEKVGDNAWALVGEIGGRSAENHGLNNTLGFLVSPKGVILIGSGATPAGARLIEQTIAGITAKPIRWVINIGAQDHHWLGNSHFADKGAEMTSRAFASVIPGSGAVLALVISMFAYSTMISWSYYGERSWEYLFGEGSLLLYRLIFVAFVFLGAVSRLANVIDFSDMMILGMAFPNIVGGVILSPQIKERIQEYWGRLQRGEMRRYR